MGYVLKIEVVGPDRKARRLSLGGVDWTRTTHGSVVRKLGLAEGEVDLSADQLDNSIDAIEVESAKERAFYLLSCRARSRFELAKRLTDDGFPQIVVDVVVHRIEELGYLDDEEYADSLVKMKIAAGWGARKILDALAQRGVSEEIVEQVRAKSLGRDAQFDQALALVRQRSCESRKDRDRILRRLISKGYSADVAFDVIRDISNDEEGKRADDLLS